MSGSAGRVEPASTAAAAAGVGCPSRAIAAAIAPATRGAANEVPLQRPSRGTTAARARGRLRRVRPR